MDLNPYYNFVVLDLFHKNNFRNPATIESRQIAHTRSDTCVSSGYWQQFIIANINTHNINCDSPFEHVRIRSEALLTQEIAYAFHLGIDRI